MGTNNRKRLERLARQQNRLTLAQQCAAMSSRMPLWRLRSSRRGIARWEGWLQPTEYSDRYKIRIELTEHGTPKVNLLSHPITNDKGERAPHLYNDDRLCLYQPAYKEWRPDMFIHETIIPWSSLWLYHYENWLITGKWFGGGEHPRPNKD